MVNEKIEELLNKLVNVKEDNGGWLACCPAHVDRSPSLRIDVDKETGNILLKCFAGCEFKQIIKALGINSSDLFIKQNEQRLKTFPLSDSTKKWLAENGKQYDEATIARFKIRETEINNEPVIVIPAEDCYRLYSYTREKTKRWQVTPKGVGASIIKGELTDTVIICEGEWDFLAAYNSGITSIVTSTIGASSFPEKYINIFTNKKIIICFDNDKPGKDGAEKLANKLKAQKYDVYVAELPEEYNDISDYINAGNNLEIVLENASHFNSKLPEYISSVKLDNILTNVTEDIRRHVELGRLGIPTGFAKLDWAIEGFQPSHLWCIAGYTSKGKTTFVLQLIKNVLFSDPNEVIAFFSLEMSSVHNVTKLISNISGIPENAIRKGTSGLDKQKVDKAFELLRTKKNIYFFDRITSYNQLVETITILKQTIGLSIAVIDYVQNIEFPGGIYERMSTIAPRLRDLATIQDCTIITLSQISNEGAEYESEVIKIKGGGELPAAAAVILWLTRKDDSPDMDVIIRKNKHGPKGTMKVRFINHFTSIEEVSNFL